MKPSHVLLFSASLLSFQAHAMDPDEIVEIVYDRNVTYSPGLFHHYKDGTTLSTQAQRSQKSWNQKVFYYAKVLQEFVAEKVLKKVIPGQDGRTRISNTTEWPYSINTQLAMTFNGEEYGGSGAMVGPHHLLTCGHNIYDKDKNKWAEKILVYPALNGNIAPFGEVNVVKAYTLKGYIDPKNKQSENNDMALLVLDKSIGEYTGWGGILALDDKSLSQEQVNITGYPGDKGFSQMWSMNHILKTITPQKFYYEIDTFGGQSGSPIWINKWGMPMILGVHTLGGDAINSGVRISDPKLKDFLIKIISDSYTINDKAYVDGSFDFEQWRSNLKKINEPWAAIVHKEWFRQDVPELLLRNKGLGGEAAIAISEALKHNAFLKKLDLSQNWIGDEGAIEIGKALEMNTSLKTLSLTSNNISNFGSISIANSLKINSSLTNLYMGRNNIEDEGVIAITDVLKTNTSLLRVDLHANWAGKKGDDAIKEICKTNKKVKITNDFWSYLTE